MKTRLAVMLVSGNLLLAQAGWWSTEPVRWVQTNLREVDAAMDTGRLVTQLAEMRANVVLMGMGGITAYYPTRVAFHYPSPYLPPGRDMFGDVLKEAHARGIRVVGRYDLSKTQKAAYDRHPEWFFRKTDGAPVVYNGLYSTCINGGYYRGQAMNILAEGLERYDVDGLFFNMFGNQSTDYSGTYVGLCHCDACRAAYRKRYAREIPERADEDYRKFLLASAREVSASIGKLIREKRPHAGYFNYMQEYTDGIMSESNTAVRLPLPLWPYSASDNVNRALNSQPGSQREKLPVDLNMQFVDYWWRFATVPRQEIATRMWQNMANGGALTFEVNGTLDMEDRQAYETAKPIFQWAAANQQHYAGLRNAGRVLLLAGPSSRGAADDGAYRGIFRLLTEEHIPFAVSENMEWLGKRVFDLVIATDWAPGGLEQYVEQGGHLLIASSRPPEFSIARVIATTPDVKGYLRVRNHTLFPSLADTDLLMLNGPFTALDGDGRLSLSLVPPSMIGPPEKVHIDMQDTNTPGMVTKSLGQGTVVWLPWELGALYYRHSLLAHAGLFRDVVAKLYPRRQLKTNAHPLVAVTLMEQGGRTQLHFINFSGHSQTAWFAPVPMREIRVELLGAFHSARAVRHPMEIKIRTRGGYSELMLPELLDYELVVLN